MEYSFMLSVRLGSHPHGQPARGGARIWSDWMVAGCHFMSLCHTKLGALCTLLSYNYKRLES